MGAKKLMNNHKQKHMAAAIMFLEHYHKGGDWFLNQ